MTYITRTPSARAANDLTPGTLDQVLAGGVVIIDDKKNASCFVPGILKSCPDKCHRHGSKSDCGGGKPHRIAENVEAITALVLDCDHVSLEAKNTTQKTLKQSGVEYYIYYTFSNEDVPDTYCFRIVIPLKEQYPAASSEAWTGVRELLVGYLGLDPKLCDPACKDLARLYYAPSAPSESRVRPIEHNTGTLLDWHTVSNTPSVEEKTKVVVAHPERDETRPVDLEKIRSKLNRISSKNRPLLQALLAGKALTPPPEKRLAGDLARRNAWFKVTGVVSVILDGWESSAAVLELFRPSFSAMVADSPDDHTEWQTIVDLFEESRASAAEKKAEQQAAYEAKMQAGKDLRLEVIASRVATSRAEFSQTSTAPTETLEKKDAEPADKRAATDWCKLLTMAPKGKDGDWVIKKCPENVSLILRKAPEWEGVLRFNVLTQTAELVDSIFEKGILQLTDHLVMETVCWLSKNFDLICSSKDMFEHMLAAAHANKYDPISNYLNSVQWDGQDRLSSVLVDFFNVQDTAWARVVGKRWMVSAVARGLQEGSQVDCMLILEGPQGYFKTSALKAIAGGPSFFTTYDGDTQSDDAVYVIHSKWFTELGELEAVRKSEVTQLKAWLSKTTDTYRPKYGRTTIDKPRRCLFVGSTNEIEYLKDSSNRRFWPVKVCEKINIEKIKKERDQLWAQAVHLFKSGEQWWLTPEEEKLAALATEERLPTDVVKEFIEEWVTRVAVSQRQNGFTMHEIASKGLNMSAEQAFKLNTVQLGRILSNMGWERRGRKRLYFPPQLPLTLVGTEPLKDGLPGIRNGSV